MMLRFDHTPELVATAAYKNMSILWLLATETFVQVQAYINIPVTVSDWSPATQAWRLARDCSDQQYLNNADSDPTKWTCERCPEGAACSGSTVWSDVRPLAGFWRVPWSLNNGSVFEKCPYFKDCLGYEEDSTDEEEPTRISANSSIFSSRSADLISVHGFRMSTVQEGCLDGTEGVLCNQCKEGFNRDGVTCQKCQASSFGLRLSLLIIAGLIVLWLVAVCRHHLKRKWHRFKPLWRDVLRIISINVTFAQINSSLPAVIDVSWPPNFIAFVAKFNIVNIDLMSVLGTNCIGNFSFILSFIFMTMMPISIAVIGLIEYLLAHRLMVRRLSLMTDERKKKKRTRGFAPPFQDCRLGQFGCN
jgi:hypothetical protein